MQPENLVAVPVLRWLLSRIEVQVQADAQPRLASAFS
jgi:hypothetical protein